MTQLAAFAPTVRCWGAESGWHFRLGGLTVFFGIGPRFPDATPEQRCELLFADEPGLEGIRWCEQIHSTLLASLSSEPGLSLRGAACVGRADGLLSAESGLGLAVWTADCVPVVVAGREAFAVVHCGWRGTAAGMLPQAVRRLALEYGEEAAELAVALGPAVASCHYEVGSEVVERLAVGGPERAAWSTGSEVDLRAYLQRQSTALGVSPERVHLVGGCTACSPALASYRRDGTAAGRQLSLAFRPAAPC